MKPMTVNKLIERLEMYRDDHGGDVEVRIMTQQNWPFENSVYGLALKSDIMHEADEDTNVGGDTDAEDDADVLYIVEGEQLGYGSKSAWDVATR